MDYYDSIKRFSLLMEATNISNVSDILYHATYKPLLDSIMKLGLGASGESNWEDSKKGIVYLADDQDVAESYAETSDKVKEEWLDQIIILEIDTSSLSKEKFFVDRNNQAGDTIEYHGIIPPKNITVIS